MTSPWYKVFKNGPLGPALSVTGGVIVLGLSRSTPSGHYIQTAAAPGNVTEAGPHSYLGRGRGERPERGASCTSKEWQMKAAAAVAAAPVPAPDAAGRSPVWTEAPRTPASTVGGRLPSVKAQIMHFSAPHPHCVPFI